MAELEEPATKEQYEARYIQNFKVTGYGLEVTNHFPCPFCAAPDWHAVRLLDFSQSTQSMDCSECGRSARTVVTEVAGGTSMHLEQTGGPDAPDWVPIARAG